MSDPAAAPPEHQELIQEFLRLRQDLLGLVEDSSDLLGQVHPSHRESAENLLHYIALRSRDLRPIQMRLAKAGLSSLGRAESHVLSGWRAGRGSPTSNNGPTSTSRQGSNS
jgi:pyruvate kinase